MKKFIICISLILIFNCPAISAELTILHTSDIHGTIFPSAENKGGFARIVNITNTYNNDNTIIVDTGDYYQGSIYNSLYKWKYTTSYMKYAKYDVATFGNHEFDNGLYSLKKYLKHTQTDYISSNLKFNDKYFTKRVKPYKIFNADNKKILFLGVTTPRLKDLSNVQNVEILNTTEVLNKYISEIPHDKVILLSHCGFDFDKEIAKNVKGINVILGGHDHIYKKTKINNTLIVHTGEYGYTIDKITYDTTKHSLLQSCIPVNEQIEANQYIEKQLNKVQAKTQKLLDKKISHTNLPLDGRKEFLRAKQTNLGKLILKSMTDKFNDGYDVAFINAGGIRTDSIIKGDIKISDVYQILPFDNRAIKGTIDGATLKKILNKGSKHGKTYLQYLSKTNEFADNKQYTVVTLDYLYKGGDGYSELQNLKIKKTSHKFVRDIFKEYLIKHPVLNEI